MQNKIYLMRHGLDDENYMGGWSEVSLINEGINQVKKASKFLQEKDIRINKIYSSDIKRAKESAQIIGNAFDLKINYTNLLRELNKGLLNGILISDAKKLYNEYLELSINEAYPNGESLVDLYNRIHDNLEWILSLEDSLIVTHRGVINMIYYIWNDIPLDINKKRFNVTHASIHELDKGKRLIKRIY